MSSHSPFGKEWFARHLEVLWWFVADPPFYSTAYAEYCDALKMADIVMPDGILIKAPASHGQIGYWAKDPEALMAWYVQAGLLTQEQIERFKAAWTLWQMGD